MGCLFGPAAAAGCLFGPAAALLASLLGSFMFLKLFDAYNDVNAIVEVVRCRVRRTQTQNNELLT